MKSRIASGPLRALGLLLAAFAPPLLAASLLPVSRTAATLPNDAGNAGSAATTAALSADGCRAVFSSAATNLVPGQVDLNGVEDVFLHDCTDGSITLLSRRAGTVATTGASGSNGAVISPDGRYVAFLSAAPDLIDGLQRNHSQSDLYLYDSDADTLQLVNASGFDPQSTTELGAGSPVFSGDSAWLLFGSAATDVLSFSDDSNNGVDLFLRELSSGSTMLVTGRPGFCFADACTANAGVLQGVLSADGRYVAYTTTASNVVSGQNDDFSSNDVFVWDRQTGTRVLASRTAASALEAAGARSENPAISADGAWVAYTSHATSLVAGQDDSNGDSDVFLFELATGTTTLVSHLPGQPAATDADGWSGNPALNADGSLVAFTSVSQDLVTGQMDASPLSDDLFVFQRSDGSLRLVSHAAGAPLQAGSGSATSARFTADGSHLVFVSRADDLVAGQADLNAYGDGLMGEDVFRHDLDTAATQLLSHVPALPAQAGRYMSFTASTDASGEHVLFVSDADDLTASDDGNDARDILKWSAATDTVSQVSRRDPAADPVGMIGASEAVVSADGRWVAFTSGARNVYPGLVDDDTDNTSIERDDDVFLLDRDTGEYVLVSRSAAGPDVTGNDDSISPQISGDGRYVVFASAASDLVAGQVDGNNAHDIFLFDRSDRSVTLLSHAGGAPLQVGNGASSSPEISRDGAWVVFSSAASNLVSGGSDANGASDVFLYEVASGALRLVSRSSGSATTAGNGDARAARISADGRYVAYQSTASDHIGGGIDFNGGNDVFLFDRDAVGNPNRLVSRSSDNASWAGSGPSHAPALSADGRYVGYLSEAGDLLPGFFIDGNSGADVFLFDRDAGFAPNVLVSRLPGEDSASGDDASTDVAISDDGQRVAFLSRAQNLVLDQQDTMFTDDLFVFETASASVRLVSVSAYAPGMAVGADRAEISGDGSAILFDSRSWEIVEGLAEADSQPKTYLHLVDAEASVLISRSLRGPGYPARQASELAGITPDGAVSLFLTTSPDVVGYDGNRAFAGEVGTDAFAFERALGIPVVAAPADQAVLEDQSTGAVAFSVSDPDGPAGDLVLSARSSDQALVPNANISFGGTPESPTVEVLPGLEQSGSALITLRATDADGNIGTASFTIVVEIVNDVPQLFLPGATTVLEGQSTDLLDFTIDDPDHVEDDLLFTVASSDAAILPASGIALAGSGTARRLRATPASDAFGEVTITVQAEDPDGAVGEASFVLTVENVNDAPGFTAGGDVSVDEDTDVEIAGWASGISAGPFEQAQQLVFEVVGNSNPALFAEAPSVDAGGTLRFLPVQDASGEATVSLRLRDDGGVQNGGDDASAAQQFLVEVLPVNDAPSISGAALVEIDEDGSAVHAFTVDDVEDGPATLELAVASSDVTLLPHANLALGGSAGARSLTVTPGRDAYGTGFLELTATDAEGASTVAVLEVHVAAIDEIVDLVATLDNGIDAIAPGTEVVWVASVTNAGEDIAYGVQTLDNAPEGLLDASWTCEGFDGGWCAQSDGTGALAVDLQLPPAGYAVLTLTGHVAAEAAPVLSYAIEAAVGPETQESNPADNLAIDTDGVGERIFGSGFED